MLGTLLGQRPKNELGQRPRLVGARLATSIDCLQDRVDGRGGDALWLEIGRERDRACPSAPLCEVLE